MDYRHEIKHMISPGDAMAIRTNLSAVASLDPHARQNGSYCIRSLYFDDPADTALREKLDGVNERRKFRIRYYNDDLSYEVTLKQDNTGFITELSELDGVSSAVLVSYNGDYMG